MDEFTEIVQPYLEKLDCCGFPTVCYRPANVIIEFLCPVCAHSKAYYACNGCAFRIMPDHSVSYKITGHRPGCSDDTPVEHIYTDSILPTGE